MKEERKNTMKKISKISILMMLSLVMLAMTACGGGSKPETESASSKEILFKDNVFENDKVKVEITKYEVIQPGDTTYNEYNDADIGEGPVIAFWYNATNKTSEDVDPIGAWLEANFKAIQDNDPNKVNELEVSSSPDSRFLESQSETIKEGGTVEGCWGYILDDVTTPVILISENVVDGGDYGKQEFDILSKSGASSNEQTNSEDSSDSDETEISSDFKAAMDSYEEFFDEYVDFMKKYKDNPTDTTLLAESADMLTKEAEMLKEMESMDQSEMTTAEAAYYLEVMARINKKLSSVL